MQTQPGIEEYLAGFERRNGILIISQPRDFAHEETDYDRQYDLDRVSIEYLRQEAARVVSLLRENGMRPGASVLEIGCGTGRLTVGLSLQPEIGSLLVTDPSPRFCEITKQKLDATAIEAGQANVALFDADEMNRLPAGLFSVILLRSVLHHFIDPGAFLTECGRVLPSGGLMLCEEPCYEGYMVMGILAQFGALAMAAHGTPCTPDEKQRLDHFRDTMQFYCRRDLDKTLARISMSSAWTN
jgi:ubiquinone/menaquinone biosynthesis C-methylase UbiE